MSPTRTSTVLTELLDAVWPGREPVHQPLRDLETALALARANQVEGVLARRYPAALGAELDRVRAASAAFDAALREAATLLRAREFQPVLIKYVPGADHVYSNFDLVVGDALPEAVAALGHWGVRTVRHPLERSKILVHPAVGPAAHLHQQASWWDVPSIDGDGLRARARDDGLWLVPAPADELRIWIAHAVFQNLAFDLSELMALRPLLSDPVIAQAREHARSEGWETAFGRAVDLATDVVARLDHGESVPVPVRLPVRVSTALTHHVRHLAATGRSGAAAREVLLRGPLLVAKARRVHEQRSSGVHSRGVRVVGFSGPDGAGKSTAAAATVALAAMGGMPVRRTYLYGCFLCRRLRLPAGLRAVLGSGREDVGRTTSPSAHPPGRLRQLHAHIDTTESALRLTWVISWAAVASRRSGRTALVVADRTPLDTLVKHDLPEMSGASQRLLALLGRFTTIALLDAAGEVLERRDAEHSTQTLERARAGYRTWTSGRPAILVLSSQAQTCDRLARTVLDAALSTGNSPGSRAEPAP